MKRFSDRLVESIRKVGNPCVVDLDPRIDLMPAFVKTGRGRPTKKIVRSVIRDFTNWCSTPWLTSSPR